MTRQTRASNASSPCRLLLLCVLLPALVCVPWYLLGASMGSVTTAGSSSQQLQQLQQQQQYMTLDASRLRREHGAEKSTAAAAASTTVADDTPAAAAPVVLDVVYCINMPQETDFFRIDYAEIEALFRQTIRHLLLPSSPTTTTVRFHLLSNDDEAIRRMTAVHPALRVHDYRLHKPSNRSEAFLQRYVHQSANPMEMERLCMWRWIVLADYITELSQQQQQQQQQVGGNGNGNDNDNDNTPPPRFVLGIDTDVGLFQPPSRMLSEWKLQHWADHGLECHQIASGAAMLWSPKGLESFADFVGAVYATPEEASRRVVEWGGTFPFCRPERSLLLPCDEKAAKPEMRHMSDMDILRAWFRQNVTVRTRKEEERCLVVRQLKRASGVRLFLHRDGDGKKEAPTLMGIRPSDTNSSSNDTAAREPEEVCMLHFQGPKSKQLIMPFDAFLEGGSGNVGRKEGEEGGEEEFVLP